MGNLGKFLTGLIMPLITVVVAIAAFLTGLHIYYLAVSLGFLMAECVDGMHKQYRTLELIFAALFWPSVIVYYMLDVRGWVE